MYVRLKTLLAFIPLNVLMASFALAVDVLGKWIILGRRSPGIYPWDEVRKPVTIPTFHNLTISVF